MRILVVNSNTSQFVTDQVAAEAQRAASPETEICAVTGKFGGRIIGTRTENAIAAHAMVDAMARNAEGCDGALIAVSFDTVLDAVREMLPIPVVGMTEAALLTACMLGGGIGLICCDRRGQRLYEETVRRHGLGARIAGWRLIESTKAYEPGGAATLDDEIVSAAMGLVDEAGAETIVPLGAIMAGIPRRIQPRVPVPVLDGIDCGVRQVELLIRLAVPQPSAGSYAIPKSRETQNLSEALGKALKG